MALVRLTDTQATVAQATLARMATLGDPDVRITDAEAQALHEALGVGMHDTLVPLPLPPQILTAEAVPPTGVAPLAVEVSATAVLEDSWTYDGPDGHQETDPPWDVEIPVGKYNLVVRAFNEYGMDEVLIPVDASTGA
jgi:hypothetical protein